MTRNLLFRKFIRDILEHTPFFTMLLVLLVLWIIFSTLLYTAEQGGAGTVISTYADALYWGVAAFSTVGIADTPTTSLGKLIGGVWCIVGSVLFFGSIVATATAYLMRPLQRPAKQIVDSIEYNLEQLDDLSVEELNLLKETVDSLIDHMETLKEQQSAADDHAG